MSLDEEEVKIIRACHPKYVPKTDDELYDWLVRVLNVRLPRKAHCDTCDAPFQILADCYFARSPVIVLKGARGAGKSFLLAALVLAEQLTLRNFTTILAASEEQSKRCLEIMRSETPITAGLFRDAPNFPRQLIDVHNENLTTSTLLHGGEVRALSASPASIRGLHPSRLRIDEGDELLYSSFKSALGQPRAVLNVDKDGRPIPGDIRIQSNVLVSSTHHLSNGTFTQLYRDQPDWDFRQYCVYDVMVDNGGWVTEEMLNQWKAMTPEDSWKVEYLLGAPSIDSRIWHPDIIEDIFDKSLGTFEGGPNSVVKIEEPQIDSKYYTGVDWAKQKDWTVISTFKRCITEPEVDIMVHWARLGRQDWKWMIEKYNKTVEAYPGTCAHDDTGSGSVIADFLTCSSMPVNFSARKKITEILRQFQMAVEQKKVKFPYIKWLKNQFEYASHEQLYGSQHLPDGICSAALAWYARSNGLGEINIFRI